MRLIDADAFKEYCRNGYEEAKHYYKDDGKFAKEITDSFCKDIDEQPTVTERTGHWIPCKERHPKERGKYLVSFTEGNQLHVSICDWQVTARHWNLTGCRSYWHPVAWMPLPEPYKKGGEDGE